MYFSKFISILVTLDLLIPLTIRYRRSINIPLRVTSKSNPKFSSPILLLMALLHLPLKFLSALKSQVVWFMATAFNKHIYFTFRGLRQWHAKWQHLKKIKLFFLHRMCKWNKVDHSKTSANFCTPCAMCWFDYMSVVLIMLFWHARNCQLVNLSFFYLSYWSVATCSSRQ